VPVSSQVITGRADDAILDHISKNEVDLVIMASSGRTGLVRAALGSTTERVLQGADPVLIFEEGEDRSRFFQAARAAYS
jgi:nucleotide-binding universal stress UspA family protein